MHRRHIIAIVVLAFVPSVCYTQKSKAVSDTAWSWSEMCSREQSRNLGIKVLLGGRAIYDSSVSICPTNYGAKPKTIVFHFEGGHIFQGKYRTRRTQIIEGNIWLAGSDPGAVLFGLSFATEHQVLLNTVHAAKPDHESRSEIDRGMWVRTFPVRSNKRIGIISEKRSVPRSVSFIPLPNDRGSSRPASP